MDKLLNISFDITRQQAIERFGFPDDFERHFGNKYVWGWYISYPDNNYFISLKIKFDKDKAVAIGYNKTLLNEKVL